MKRMAEPVNYEKIEMERCRNECDLVLGLG